MKLYTVGYEGLAQEDFLRLLETTGIELVIDVREAPRSRKRGFSKIALAEALESAHIGYRHMRPLGCPKPIRDRYRADGDWAAYTVAFLEHLRTQEAAIRESARLCADRTVALLCYEADAGRCHRSYVADAVVAVMGGDLIHIDAAVREVACGTAVARQRAAPLSSRHGPA